MSSEEHMPEDIAGLFGKFGGNGNGYKEFAAPDAEAPRVWPLLSGEKIAHPPAQASVPVGGAPLPSPAPAPAPVFAPAPKPPAVFAPAPSPALAAPVMPSAAIGAVEPGSAPTPLEQLFARLAAPQRQAVAPGPMSRWRRPT